MESHTAFLDWVGGYVAQCQGLSGAEIGEKVGEEFEGLRASQRLEGVTCA